MVFSEVEAMRVRDYTFFAVAIKLERMVRRRSENRIMRGLAYIAFPFIFGGFLGLSPRFLGLWTGSIIAIVGLLWLLVSVFIWVILQEKRG